MIESVGLKNAAELVALATTGQLESVLDEDIWRLGRNSWEERFDPTRFALWLHAFAEVGDDALVKHLIELPRELVILVVHRLVLVIHIDTLKNKLARVAREGALGHRPGRGRAHTECDVALTTIEPAQSSVARTPLPAAPPPHSPAHSGRCA